MADLISVIIPVFNRQDVIAECIASLQAQSHTSLEIILVDDGSTDQTLKICQELAREDPRIVLLAGSHCGVSAARNRALEAATGEYLFFLDSDDVIHPLLLETLVCAMKHSGAAIGGTTVLNIRQKDWHTVAQHISQNPGPGETRCLSFEDTLHAVFCTNSPLNMIGGVMIRRDWVADTRFRTDLSIGEDFYFVYQNLIKETCAVFLKQAWYYGRIHRQNTSWDYSYTGFWTRFLRRKLVWESEAAHGRKTYSDLQKQSAFHVYLDFMKRNPPRSEIARKMRQVLREHQRDLFPALSFGDKLRFLLGFYLPGVYRAILKLTRRIRRHN